MLTVTFLHLELLVLYMQRAAKHGLGIEVSIGTTVRSRLNHDDRWLIIKIMQAVG